MGSLNQRDGILKQAKEMQQDYQRDGVVVLRNVLSKEWLDKIATAIKKVKENPSKFHFTIQEAGENDGVFFMDYCNWTRIPELKELVYDSPAAEIVKILMGSKSAVFYHEHVLTKAPGTSKETVWHHDQPYYPCDGDLNCTMWIPVDPVPMESSIRFAKGSHRWGKWFYPRHFQTFENYQVGITDTNGRVYESVPDDMDSNPSYELTTSAFQPGDVCIFHMKTLHAANANMSEHDRRVLSLRWIAEDATFVKRPWDESPPLENHPGLEFGKQLLGERFPEIPTQF